MTDFMKSRGMEEDVAENRHLWRLGVDIYKAITMNILIAYGVMLIRGVEESLIFQDKNFNPNRELNLAAIAKSARGPGFNSRFRLEFLFLR